MGELCNRLDEVILLSQKEYQKKLDDNFLREVGSETLSALRDLDDQAPSKAAIAQAARAEVDVRNQNEYGGRSRTEAVDEKLERQNKPRKSERFDKIVFAKTANRVQNSQLLPEISESPKQLPEDTRLSSDILGPRHRQQQEKIPDMRLDSSDSPWVGKPSPICPPQEQPLDVLPYKTTSPESISPGLPDRGSSLQKDVKSSSTTFDEFFKVIPSGAFELPGSGAAEKSASAAGTSQLPNLVRNRPPEASSTYSRTSIHEECGQVPLPKLEGSDPELSKTAIFQEYTVLNENWTDRKKSLIKRIQGVPQDQRLQRFISKRDVVRLLSAPQPTFPPKLTQIQVFVVDNAYSMLPHWENLKTTLLALAMKIGPLDKDGLDLVYTCGDTNNVTRAKGWDIPTEFGLSIDRAKSMMNQNDKTNIEETLSKCFDSHSTTNKSQRQTLIVLTNGLWEGSTDWNSAEKEIARYINALRENIKKREKRWFTIQFISFGQDQKALKRLQELDDNLRGPEYVVIFLA